MEEDLFRNYDDNIFESIKVMKRGESLFIQKEKNANLKCKWLMREIRSLLDESGFLQLLKCNVLKNKIRALLQNYEFNTE